MEELYNADDKVKEILLGQTLIGVMDKGDEIVFVTDRGKVYKLLHTQECCENVSVEDIAGDLRDIVDSPLLTAEEISNKLPIKEDDVSGTWTFYKFATRKGSVTIRFYGSSNGYYYERVDFVEI